MTGLGRDWDEIHLSEDPAVALLVSLGYGFIPAEVLESDRESLRDVVLIPRLRAALKKLNPWLSDANLHKAVRAVTDVQAANLVEASESLHTTLSFGMSVAQDRGQGIQGQNVRFLNFENPANNDLIVTRQFRVKGAKKDIICDVVVFANGIPLAVIECKSPALGDKWLDEALDQLLRYQEADADYRDLGAPRLFETVQLLIGACGVKAVYGTVGTPKRFWGEWKVPYPRTVQELGLVLGRTPTAQDVTIDGLLNPANLLDLLRNFTVFERDGGKTLRKVPRYPQFIAVNKAIQRVHTAKKPEARGGVVWHTQGSGKSLTMVWLALKLRRDPSLDNPTLVIVTDRTDLDDQISGTFVRCGFPNPERAESVQHLRELLGGPTGKTVTTTIQKFQDATAGSAENGSRSREGTPTLNAATNVFVMVDEAHRTQYKSLAANMRKALPNACFLGFTGTPIDKNDRSTQATFGPYIDTYTIEQAVADGATVPIFYESRLPDLRIVGGQTLDALFDRVFADRTDEERREIKRRYATEEAIAGAPQRVQAICLDLLDHYTKFIAPNGFKAQVVAVSREVAVAYKEGLDRLNGPPSELVMSASHNDDAHLAKYARSKTETKAIIARFKDPKDSLAILVVCDMLLTGFDAPVEQVMYLDSPLREHSLLQAIARVNRTADKKTYGLVVDYWGISTALQDALAVFAPSDVKGALVPVEDEEPRLQARHAAVLRFFDKVKNKDDLNACVAILEPEDVRAKFEAAFRAFSQSLDMLLPDPRALRYVGDAKWLGKVRQAARARYRDASLNLADCGAKVRKLIEDAIAVEGVQILVKEVSLFSKAFEEKVAKLGSQEAKASEMEHAIRHEIHVHIEENPAFYESLRERLEKIIQDRKAERIEGAKQLELLQALVNEVRNEAQAGEALGLSPTAFAIYGVLEDRPLVVRDSAVPMEPLDKSRQELALLIEEALAPYVGIVDFQAKDAIQREMRAKVKRQLRAARIDEDRIEGLALRIVDLAKARRR